MMPLVILYEEDDDGRRMMRYISNHIGNDKYLYKGCEEEQYRYLSKVDDGSPTIFCTREEILGLMNDLMQVTCEAKAAGERTILNHLKEIIVLCKLVVWSEYRYWIEFSPFGISLDAYPEDLPEGLKWSLPEDI